MRIGVTSNLGKQAIVSMVDDNEFFGEGVLVGQLVRMSTAITVSDCTIYKIDKSLMQVLLHEQPGIAEMFAKHLLKRNNRYEEDLVDQLFNSSDAAPGPHSFIAGALWQGEQSRNGQSRNQPDPPGTNGRHHTVADQLFHEQVADTGFYPLFAQRHIDC